MKIYRLTNDYISNEGIFPKNGQVIIIHDWVNKLVVQCIKTKQYFFIHPFDSNHEFPIEVEK